MPFGLGFFATAGVSAAAGSYELIASEILTGSQASVTFSNLGDYSTTYQHLQIRLVSRQALAAGGHGQIYIQFNGDTGSNYSWHQLLGNGSSVASSAGTNTTFALGGFSPFGNETGFMPSVIDILDPYEAKNKTIRALSGAPTVGNNSIVLTSGAWRNTNSVTSITIDSFDTWVQYSRFSLYGVK